MLYIDSMIFYEILAILLLGEVKLIGSFSNVFLKTNGKGGRLFSLFFIHKNLKNIVIFNQIFKNLYIFVQNHDLKDKILQNRSEICQKLEYVGHFGPKIYFIYIF